MITLTAIPVPIGLYMPIVSNAVEGALIMGPATPFCFWTTQKHLTVERTMGSRT